MVQDKINDFLDSKQDEMIEALRSLVQIPSYRMPEEPGMPFGKGPAQCLGKALELAKKLGFTVRNIDNYVGTADLDDKEPELGILGHLDVVPEGTDWKYPPYECVVDGTDIYGRGTIDDKGPVVAALYAMYALKELGIPLKKGVRCIMGTDEECGSSDLAYYTKKEALPDMLFTPDGSYPIINIEKGRVQGAFAAEYAVSDCTPKIVSVHGGQTVNAVPERAQAVVQGFSKEQISDYISKVDTGVSFTVEETDQGVAIYAKGKSGHASTPELGVNALTGLLTLLTQMPFADCEEFTKLKNIISVFPHGETDGTHANAAVSDELSGALTLAFSVFHCENGKIEGNFDIRFPISYSVADIKGRLISVLEKNGFALTGSADAEPHHVDENSEFIQKLLKVYEEQTGEKGHCVAIGGGTYVHDTVGGVAFGAEFPGEENNMHGANEHISIESFMKNAKIFAHAIAEICG